MLLFDSLVSAAQGDAEALSSRMGQLSRSIAAGEKVLADATTILKKKEAADLAVTETELAGIIGTLRRSESEGGMAKNPATFIQVGTKIWQVFSSHFKH